MKNKSFYERCYDVLRKVPRGKVTTYREIAKKLNSKAFRAVGSAMNKNPYAPEVPCHRVVNSEGFVGGFAHGKKKKIKILKEEGIEIDEKGYIDLEKFLYKF